MKTQTKLRKLEIRAHKLAERICNESVPDSVVDRECSDILSQARALTGIDAIELNLDPRGYALKISLEWMQANPDSGYVRDAGGYGIVAGEE